MVQQHVMRFVMRGSRAVLRLTVEIDLPGESTPGEEEEEIMSKLDDLMTQVQQESTVIDSAVTLIGGLAQQLRDANVTNNPEIDAIARELASKTSQLASAVAANAPDTGGGAAAGGADTTGGTGTDTTGGTAGATADQGTAGTAGTDQGTGV